jgi:spermidine synthase
VLRHPNVVNATMIDIDKKVIDTAKRFFPTTSASFFHPRGTTFFKDGAQWAVDRCKDPSFAKVDVIIIDSTDFSAAVPLFQASFYQSMKDCVLRPGGILIHNLDSLCWDIETVRMRSERMKGIFKHVHIYQVFQPTYSGGHYAINFASDKVEPFRTPIDWEAFDAKKLRLQYYNPDIHYASFAFPGFVMTQNLGVHANKLQDIVSLPPRRLSPVEQYYERVDVFEAIRESRRNGTAKSNTVDKN